MFKRTMFPPQSLSFRINPDSSAVKMMIILTFLFSTGLSGNDFADDVILLPVKIPDRQELQALELTPIGRFGIARKSRPQIPAHLHTGIDIKRPSQNYHDEPVFSIATGYVISVRRDDAFAQIIVEHSLKDEIFWTVYEHVAGILVNVNDQVNPRYPIARFMNKDELERFGWQFDHFHFEILKTPPIHINPTQLNPDRFFKSYSLECLTQAELESHYYNPVDFFRKRF